MKHFSHIYIEEGVKDEPMTAIALKKFPHATRVAIDDYRDIFGRSGQNFQMQKQSKKLILASKKDNLLYPGNDKVQDFGYKNFHYNTLLINCIYNCAYCYLQGMFQSANLVAFVNESDFFNATEKAIRQRQDKRAPLYLAISYDTDLLGFENKLPYCEHWIHFARDKKNLMIEIRTKSANYRAIEKISPLDQAIIAWTLSPQSIIEQYEQDTPPLEQRLMAIKQAIKKGWPVRLCFDPVIHVRNWKAVYDTFFQQVFETIPPQSIRDVSLGLFRMNARFFSQLKKARPNTDLVYQQYAIENKTLALPLEQRKTMIAHLSHMIERYVPKHKIEIWT